MAEAAQRRGVGTALMNALSELALEQTTMPSQQRRGSDQPMSAQHRRQPPSQGRKNGPIGPVRLRTCHLTPQHRRHLVTQHHDLNVLRRLAAAQQHQPAEHPDRDQVEQANRHKT
ncbi:hypothetical protein AB0B45_50925 [Nonomuraea sp. NPDC049152]|uniref:hypothetical protein n=1 Tax=Nonomuraea sp. NPDC049152 TaxID=3154350 RepID=UPI003405F2F7